MPQKRATQFSELATREVIAIFERLRSQVPGFIAVSLVEVRSGTTLVAHAGGSNFDLAAAGALNREIVEREIKALQRLGSESTLEDILLILSDQFHLLKLVDGGAAFIYLAVDRDSTSLATAHYVLNDASRAPGHSTVAASDD